MNWSEIDIPAWTRIKTRRPNIVGPVPLAECVNPVTAKAVPVEDFVAIAERMMGGAEGEVA